MSSVLNAGVIGPICHRVHSPGWAGLSCIISDLLLVCDIYLLTTIEYHLLDGSAFFLLNHPTHLSSNLGGLVRPFYACRMLCPGSSSSMHHSVLWESLLLSGKWYSAGYLTDYFPRFSLKRLRGIKSSIRIDTQLREICRR